MYWIFWVVIVVVILEVLATVIDALKRYSKEKAQKLAEFRGKYHLPILCVCRFHGQVGVALRKDYDAASQAAWAPHYRGEYSRPNDEKRLMVSRSFVFSSDSPYLRTLLSKCYLEQAVFDVVCCQMDEDAAFRRILGASGAFSEEG